VSWYSVENTEAISTTKQVKMNKNDKVSVIILIRVNNSFDICLITRK